MGAHCEIMDSRWVVMRPLLRKLNRQRGHDGQVVSVVENHIICTLVQEYSSPLISHRLTQCNICVKGSKTRLEMLYSLESTVSTTLPA